MNLHRVGRRPDWQLIAPESRNVWQRIAALSAGVITPANIASVAGVTLVGWGLFKIIAGQLLIGLVAVGVGRLADAFDGAIADKTGTKSPLGEAVDVAADKLAIAAVLLVFIWQHVVPLWALIAVALLSLLNSLSGVVVKLRKLEVHSSRFGKYSTAAMWAALLGYGLLGVIRTNQWYWAFSATTDTITIIALGFGSFALVGYMRAAFGKRQVEQQRPIVPFERFVVIQNPVSTNARVGARYIAEIAKLFPDIPCEVIPTPPGGRDAIRAMLAEHTSKFGPSTLLCIAGGDGTASTVIEFLLTAGNVMPEVRQTPVLPLWGGNGNDLATMLNGLGAMMRFKHIITHGKVVPIYPLECIMRIKYKGRLVRLAAYSASFGASANVARRLDAPAHRRSWMNRFPLGRIFQSYTTGVLAWLEARPFLVTEHGITYPAYDKIFANGWRAGGLTIAPVDLVNNEFYQASYKSSRIMSIVRHAIEMVDRRVRHTRRKPVRFTVRAEAWAQFDGEPFHLAPRTKVTIKLARAPFYALSTKSKLPKAVQSAVGSTVSSTA